jgi:TRAP-type C4-dicarboxylate transport system permease small subunit
MDQTIPHAPVSAEALVQSFEEADQQAADLSGYSAEDWITVVLFWVMALLVFLQFFTRYVLNDSFAWTEELAVNCLIGVVFIGAAMCVRRDRHIQVDILYRLLPAKVSRVLSTVVDATRVGFLGYVTFLVWKYVGIVGDEPMTTIDWPKSLIYWMAFAGFALMLFHAIRIAVRNWRQGYSILEKPEAYDGTETQ